MTGRASPLSRRIAAFAWRRHGSDTEPVTLARGRIYILPTGAGMVFALLLLTMLLGAMNYDSGMGYALTFLLAGLGLVALHHGQRNLLELRLRSLGAAPVFAGEAAVFRFRLHNPGPSRRYEVFVTLDGHRSQTVDLPVGADRDVQLTVPTRARGRLTLRDLEVGSHHPGHLVRVWSRVHRPQQVLVYPPPAERAPPPPAGDDTAGADVGGDGRGSEDFAGLRGYHPGDTPRQIAWKAYAREGGLQVKQFAGGAGDAPQWLRYADAPGAVEQRLSVLCRWALDLSRDGGAFGLALPGRDIAPASGQAHRHRVLAALASFGTEDEAGDGAD